MTRNGRRTPLADLYWINSELNLTTIQSFSRGIEEHASQAAFVHRVEHPGRDLSLQLPKDGLFRRMIARKSGRRFSDRLLDATELGSLFAAFAAQPNGSRTYPSAGS
ncbi:MAG TPA: hypothetical protein VHO95_05420, partial [Candidatus Dormibacteraeota bacterium]|nr:hypothetical protein [Candidatus Dormibacteraeota bacterium]